MFRSRCRKTHGRPPHSWNTHFLCFESGKKGWVEASVKIKPRKGFLMKSLRDLDSGCVPPGVGAVVDRSKEAPILPDNPAIENSKSCTSLRSRQTPARTRNSKIQHASYRIPRQSVCGYHVLYRPERLWPLESKRFKLHAQYVGD